MDVAVFTDECGCTFNADTAMTIKRCPAHERQFTITTKERQENAAALAVKLTLKDATVLDYLSHYYEQGVYPESLIRPLWDADLVDRYATNGKIALDAAKTLRLLSHQGLVDPGPEGRWSLTTLGQEVLTEHRSLDSG